MNNKKGSTKNNLLSVLLWYLYTENHYFARQISRVKIGRLRDRSKFMGYIGQVLEKICLKKSLPLVFFEEKSSLPDFFRKKSSPPVDGPGSGTR